MAIPTGGLGSGGLSRHRLDSWVWRGCGRRFSRVGDGVLMLESQNLGQFLVVLFEQLQSAEGLGGVMPSAFDTSLGEERVARPTS